MPYADPEKRRQAQARWYREKYGASPEFQQAEAKRKAEWLQTEGKPMNAAASKRARYIAKLRKRAKALAPLIVLAFASCATPQPLTFSTPEQDAQRLAERRAFFEKHKAPIYKPTPLTAQTVSPATPLSDLEYRVRMLEHAENARFNDSIVFRREDRPLYP